MICGDDSVCFRRNDTTVTCKRCIHVCVRFFLFFIIIFFINACPSVLELISDILVLHSIPFSSYRCGYDIYQVSFLSTGGHWRKIRKVSGRGDSFYGKPPITHIPSSINTKLTSYIGIATNGTIFNWYPSESDTFSLPALYKHQCHHWMQNSPRVVKSPRVMASYTVLRRRPRVYHSHLR
jgi:hypothetical protein